MNAAGVPLPQVRGFVLVIARDGRVRVDDWNALTADQQRQIAEYVVANYPRGHEHGSDA
jgi:hypothetical protein